MSIQLTDIDFSWENSPCLSIDRYIIQDNANLLIYGGSGYGKTTLLSLIAGFIVPEKGEIIINGEDITRLSQHKRDRFRADNIGFIFQQFNLVPYLTADENIRLPYHFSNVRKRNIQNGGGVEKRKNELLKAFDLNPKETARKKTYELSIGQQQRVAAARALMGEPSLIIADEPTSALDPVNSGKFMDHLLTQSKQTGASLIVVSHDPGYRDLFPSQLDIERFKP